jgi:hypothetical protein
MAGQIYLSYWLRGYNERTMLGHFGRLRELLAAG